MIHRDYPLPHDDWSKPVAYLGRAVTDTQGIDPFWTYLGTTLAEDSLNRETIITHATDAGLGKDTAESEFDETSYCDVVKDSKSRGDEVGVKATLQAYFNNELHDPLPADQTVSRISG